MFTGIIKEIGRVARIIKIQSSVQLAVESVTLFPHAAISDSIAVSGTCLTLVRKERNLLIFDAVAPTLKATNLKRLKRGDYLNLEPALKVGDTLGGHFVLGHVDTEARVRRFSAKGNYRQLEIELPPLYKKFAVENGSIAPDGISPSIKKVFAKACSIDIVPFTFQNTTLRYKRPGDWLNIEFDYLLKRTQ